jgi:hypothetical protein
MIRVTLLAIATMLVVRSHVRANPEELPPVDSNWTLNQSLLEKDEPAANGIPTPTDGGQPSLNSEITPCPDVGPPARWDVDFAYVPTTIFFDNDEMGNAYRLNIAREEPDGCGRRARFWLFQDHIFSADLVSTLFTYDFYRQVRFERGEVKYGWAIEAAYDHQVVSHHFDHNFFGAGPGIFLEGFYPLVRDEKTQIGPVGSGRLATLIGVEDNDGSIEFGQGTIPLIEEFTWGLELRRRFGAHGDKTFYVDVTRDLQNWGQWDVPLITYTSFQGTAVHLGFAW